MGAWARQRSCQAKAQCAVYAAPKRGFFIARQLCNLNGHHRANCIFQNASFDADPVVGTKGRGALDWPGLKRLSLVALIGPPIGLFGLVYLDAGLIRLAIAAIVVVGVLLLPKAHPDTPVRLGLAAPSGVLAGLFGGLAAMPGPPVVAYYLSGSTPSKVIRATMMVFFFTSLLASPGLALGGLLDGQTLLPSSIAIPIMLAGTALCGAIFTRAPDAAYKPVALAVLIVMALSSGLRGLLDVLG